MTRQCVQKVSKVCLEREQLTLRPANGIRLNDTAIFMQTTLMLIPQTGSKQPESTSLLKKGVFGQTLFTGAVRLLVTGFLYCLVVFTTGCSPSARYNRYSGDIRIQNGKVLVKPDWDYRKSYQLPTDRVVIVTNSYLGIPYRFAGMNRRGVDCSGLVCLVYRDVAMVKLPHSSSRQFKLGKPVSLSQAKPGDLVFFRGGIFGTINHVGIYIKEQTFVHASTSKGVTYANLDDDYFKQRFVGVRRIF